MIRRTIGGTKKRPYICEPYDPKAEGGKAWFYAGHSGLSLLTENGAGLVKFKISWRTLRSAMRLLATERSEGK